MAPTRILIFPILFTCLSCLLSSCNEEGRQAGLAAAQDPRYEIIPELASNSQTYYFTEFEGNQAKSIDSLKYHLREVGDGQFVQYELYNTFQKAEDYLELDVLESFIDTGDTIQSQKVRDEKFVLRGDSLSLSRFDTKKTSLEESYALNVGDTTYTVYNFLGFAHQADYTPSHRIFFTERFGSFVMWYGDWNTIELTHTKYPDAPEDLLMLRAEVRDLLSIPFAPGAP